MIAPNPSGNVDLFYRVPAADAGPVRCAIDVVAGYDPRRLERFGVGAEDLADGALLLTWPVTWTGWNELVSECPDTDELHRMERARRACGKALVNNILESARHLNPTGGAAVNRPD